MIFAMRKEPAGTVKNVSLCLFFCFMKSSNSLYKFLTRGLNFVVFAFLHPPTVNIIRKCIVYLSHSQYFVQCIGLFWKSSVFQHYLSNVRLNLQLIDEGKSNREIAQDDWQTKELYMIFSVENFKQVCRKCSGQRKVIVGGISGIKRQTIEKKMKSC